MNESPNYRSLNTCARDLKSPERLSLLTIFITPSVIALDGISEEGGSVGAPVGHLPRRCSNAAVVPVARVACIF